MKKFNIIFILIVSIIIIGIDFFVKRGGLFLLDRSFFPANGLDISSLSKPLFWILVDVSNYILGYEITSKGFFLLTMLITIIFGFYAGGVIKNLISSKNKNIVYIISALFFCMNPVFYERMVTQPGVFLGIIMYGFGLLFMLQNIANENKKNLILSFVFFGIGINILPHSIFFVILSMLIYYIIQKKSWKQILKNILIFVGVACIININTVIYSFINIDNTFSFFNYSNIDNFKTNNLKGGVDFTVLNLYGFWPEKYNRIATPEKINPNRYISGIFVILLSIYGIFTLIKNKDIKIKNIGKLLFLLFLISRILGGGIASDIFGWLNIYFYKLIPFYYGFRDSTKRNGIIMIVYGIGFTISISKLFEYIINSPKLKSYMFKSENINYIVYTILVTLTLFSWVSPLYLGFRGQLNIGQYPNSYFETKNYLIKNGFQNKKFIALPRDSYLACQRNGKVSPNQMGNIFKPLDMKVSDNIQIGYLYSNNTSEESKDILNFTKKHDTNLLKKHGFEYIAFFEKCGNYEQYNFLTGTESIQKLTGNNDINIYKIK